MPARTVKTRHELVEEGPLDAIPPGVLEGLSAPRTDGAAAKPLAPPPPAQSPGVSDPPARTLAERQAARLEDRGWGGLMFTSLVPLLGPDVEVYTFTLMVDNFLAQLGPTGPVEKLLAEQLFMAHHLTGHLHARAMLATNPDAAKAFLAAAARLMAEFRQSAVALNALRASATPTAATPAKSDGVKPTGSRPARPREAAEPLPDCYTEVRSNRLKELFPDAFAEQSA